MVEQRIENESRVMWTNNIFFGPVWKLKSSPLVERDTIFIITRMKREVEEFRFSINRDNGMLSLTPSHSRDVIQKISIQCYGYFDACRERLIALYEKRYIQDRYCSNTSLFKPTTYWPSNVLWVWDFDVRCLIERFLCIVQNEPLSCHSYTLSTVQSQLVWCRFLSFLC